MHVLKVKVIKYVFYLKSHSDDCSVISTNSLTGSQGAKERSIKCPIHTYNLENTIFQVINEKVSKAGSRHCLVA